MADTYTQCYMHLIFSPKNREALINKKWKDELEKYICSIVQANGHKLLSIGGTYDHVHILIGYNVNQRIPDLINEIKTSTTKWIKENKLSNFKYEWQKGYGAFTHSKSQIKEVINYVLNQEQHHAKRSFREEYLEILRKNEIEFQDGYLFDFFN